MAQLVQQSPVQQQRSWRDVLIDRSVVITDAWEVTKIYSGRLAEWVLFGCMVGNIVEILPQVGVPLGVSNAILGVQTVTLDVAGFGLATMADSARANGDTKAANTARNTSYLLIGLMIVTVAIVTTGLLWPTMKPITDVIDKALILVRVILTVIYGHVVHTLRRASASQQSLIQQVQQQLDELRRLHTVTMEQHQRERDEALVTIGNQRQQMTELHTTIQRLQAQAQSQPREVPLVVSAAKLERHTEKTRAMPAPTAMMNMGDIRERIRTIHQAEPELSSRKIAERLGKIVSHTTVTNHLKAIEAEQKECEA